MKTSIPGQNYSFDLYASILEPQVKIIVKYQAKPQHGEALEKALRGIIETIRSARGCVQCDLHPSLDHRLVFISDQLWESREYWEAFMDSENIREFKNLTEGMVDEYNLCTAEH